MNTEILQPTQCLNQLRYSACMKVLIKSFVQVFTSGSCATKDVASLPYCTRVLFNPCDLRIYALKMGLANTHTSGCYLSHLDHSSYNKCIKTYSVINKYKTKCTAQFLHKAYKFPIQCLQQTPQKICNNTYHTVPETVV